jgi:hypothetical protein
LVELLFDVFDQLRELGEVAVVKTSAPCQFPDALDRIQFGTAIVIPTKLNTDSGRTPDGVPG